MPASKIRSSQLYRLDVVQEIVPRHRVREAAMAVARAIAAKPPLAIEAAKKHTRPWVRGGLERRENKRLIGTLPPKKNLWQQRCYKEAVVAKRKPG